MKFRLPGLEILDNLNFFTRRVFHAFWWVICYASLNAETGKTDCCITCFFVFCETAPPPQWAWASSFTRFLDHTQRRNTVSRNPLDEWSARRRDIYLTAHTKLTTDNFYAPCGIRTHILSRRAAADLPLRPRGHWNRGRITWRPLFISL